MASRRAALTLALLLTATPIASVLPQEATLDSTAAAKLLVQRTQDDGLYASWTTVQCLRFMLESTTAQHFDFVIRERHDGKCPGDPATEPVVDRFRVNRR